MTGDAESILSPVFVGPGIIEETSPVQITDVETGLPILGNQVFIASSPGSGEAQRESQESTVSSIVQAAVPNDMIALVGPSSYSEAAAEEIQSAVLEGVSAGLKKDDGGDGSQTGDPATTSPVVTVSLQNPTDSLPDLPILGPQGFIGVSSNGDGVPDPNGGGEDNGNEDIGVGEAGPEADYAALGLDTFTIQLGRIGSTGVSDPVLGPLNLNDVPALERAGNDLSLMLNSLTHFRDPLPLPPGPYLSATWNQ